MAKNKKNTPDGPEDSLPVQDATSEPETKATESPEPEQKTEVELLKEAYEQLQDKNLRLMAEYDNFRKRSQREKDDIYQNAVAAAVQKLLPIQDNFERAKQFECHTEEFAKGFEMIEKSFSDTLASMGVEPFGEVGEPFDPEKHHAVMHIEDEALGTNVVAQVLQRGYRMGDRILRYAMVQTAN